MGRVNLVLPLKDDAVALLAFDALVNGMLDKQVMGLVRFISSEKKPPILGVLYPFRQDEGVAFYFCQVILH